MDIVKQGQDTLDNKFYKVVLEQSHNIQDWQVSHIGSEVIIDTRYVQFNVKKIERSGASLLIIQIVDVSKNLLYDKMSAKSEFQSLINATVSHEMKNPLNSIISQSLNLKSIIQDFGEAILDFESIFSSPTRKKFKNELGKMEGIEFISQRLKGIYKQAR